ncbi:MAG: hypothetical protein KIT84_34275 [Labilithrix sp.]|nr:hypothetical protein [Labilithrix sp.]MCW5816114.1 hypothetical protein [Labilithrix sp.]
MTASPFIDLAVTSGGDAGSVLTSRFEPSTPQGFSLQQEYAVAGGIIANGTISFVFRRPNGQDVTCTYQGQSPTATPTTQEALLLGRVLRFQGCTDRQPASARRTGTNFRLTVNPAPNYPVTVKSPVTQAGGCTDEMEIITPVETARLRREFSWARAQKVAEVDSRGAATPLYYAWVYLRHRDDALALRRLSIHLLSRPLLDSELAPHAGKCGVFTNPGDGNGTFVPVLIPGATYNRLIDLQTTRDVTGDRTIFEAVVIRNLPSGLRNANGSLRLELLGRSGFRYLDYETTPLDRRGDIALESGSVARVLVDATAWLLTRIKDAVQLITTTIASVFAGPKVPVTLYLHAVTQDPAFVQPVAGIPPTPDPVMIRGWGPLANHPLAAAGMRVTILQRVGGLLPTALWSKTNNDGMAVVDMFAGETPRGSGLCLQLDTPRIIMTNFLVPADLCDFRGYDAARPTPGDFRLDEIGEAAARSSSAKATVHIDHEWLSALYQSDDAALWARDVIPYETPHRQRIVAGFWPTTIRWVRNEKVFPTTSCLSFLQLTGTGAQLVLNAATRGDGILTRAGLPPTHPAAAVASQVFLNTMLAADSLLPDGTAVRAERGLFSHEFGHFLFCSLLHDAQDGAVDYMARQAVGGTDLTTPLQYTNEGIADFISGQVAGSAAYNWPAEIWGFHPNSGTCYRKTASTASCFDANVTGAPGQVGGIGQPNVGRIATLLHDVYDGHGQRFALVPGDGDIWAEIVPRPTAQGAASLGVAATGFGNLNDPERVRLAGDTLKTFAAHFAERLALRSGDLRDADTYAALNAAMSSASQSWCDRCRVFALHSPSAADPPTVGNLFETCLADGLVRDALGGPPPEPSLRLNAATCTPCAPNETSNADGVCVFCPDTVVGNRCVKCPADVTFDGATLTEAEVNAGLVAPGDTCPDVFWAQVTNPGQLVTRGAHGLTVDLYPNILSVPAECQRPFTLRPAREFGSGLQFEPPLTASGTFNTEIFAGCGKPVVRYKMENASLSAPVLSVWFGTPTDSRTLMLLDAAIFPEPK